MYAVRLNHLGLLIVTALVFGSVGCSDLGGSDVANLNGTWQTPSKQKVVINLTGEQKTIVIGDKTLPVTVKPMEANSCILRISDATSGERDWKLSRVWDDNGKSFTLKFEHDGQTEDLERVKG